MFKCKWCDKEYDNYNSLGKHTSRTHKIDRKELRIQYFHDGIHPVCECGCGEEATFHSSRFLRFKKGHNAKVDNPMSGKTHTEKARQAISEKRKEKFASGEYRIWQNEDTEETRERFKLIGEKVNKENNPERAKKISKKLTGKKRSKLHQSKLSKSIKKAWSDPKLRERQSHNRMKMIKENGWEIKSKLEDEFASILDELNIRYHRQHYVRAIKALYDFYLSDYDIIVEVHGDFWHCKPGSKYEIPKYSTQLKNIKNDEKKRTWCELHDKTLLVFWESDIKDNPSEVKRQLLEHLKLTP